jgi:UPF0271 protein
VAFEAFPDRAYSAEGILVPRDVAGAVIKDPDEVAERALRVVTEQKMVASDGSVIDLKAQTLCVHGDTPTALQIVSAIREKLESHGVQLMPMSKFLS